MVCYTDFRKDTADHDDRKKGRKHLMSTLVYSIRSHRKVVHLPRCRVLQRIPEENLRCFTSLAEGMACGYRLCSCCSSVTYRYRKEQAEIQSFCQENHYVCKLINGAVHVISSHDFWRIIIDGNKTEVRLSLYHRNTARPRIGKSIDASAIPGYHIQEFGSDTILGC